MFSSSLRYASELTIGHLTMLTIVNLDTYNEKQGHEHLKRGKGRIIEKFTLPNANSEEKSHRNRNRNSRFRSLLLVSFPLKLGTLTSN